MVEAFLEILFRHAGHLHFETGTAGCSANEDYCQFRMVPAVLKGFVTPYDEEGGGQGVGPRGIVCQDRGGENGDGVLLVAAGRPVRGSRMWL